LPDHVSDYHSDYTRRGVPIPTITWTMDAADVPILAMSNWITRGRDGSSHTVIVEYRRGGSNKKAAGSIHNRNCVLEHRNGHRYALHFRPTQESVTRWSEVLCMESGSVDKQTSFTSGEGQFFSRRSPSPCGSGIMYSLGRISKKMARLSSHADILHLLIRIPFHGGWSRQRRGGALLAEREET